MVAILKFFKWYLLPNRKWDWAITWWGSFTMTQRFRIAKIFPFWCPRPPWGGWGGGGGGSLNSSNDISSQTISQIELKLDGRHWSSYRDSELLKSFRSNIQDGCQPWRPSWNSWAQTWWEALGPHGDLEMLKSFRSNIQDGRGGQLENLETTPALER